MIWWSGNHYLQGWGASSQSGEGWTACLGLEIIVTPSAKIKATRVFLKYWWIMKLYQSVTVKRDMSSEEKMSVCLLLCHLSLGTDQKNKMMDPRGGRMPDFRLINRARSSIIWVELRVQLMLFHIKGSQLRWFGYLTRTHPGFLSG